MDFCCWDLQNKISLNYVFDKFFIYIFLIKVIYSIIDRTK
jgi:hypothetical protein